MDWAAVVGGAIAPVTGLIDGAWYTEQERAADALAADAVRAQEAIARQQAEAMVGSARYGALAAETQSQGIVTAVLIGAGALVVVGTVFVLAR